MAFWNGTLSSDFLLAGNWDTGIVPNATEFVTLDLVGDGLNLDPTLFSGDSASILNLEMFARTFTVEGSLTVNTHALISGPGILSIANTGTVTVGGSGVTVDGGALNNFGTLNSTVEITNGGVVTNGGAITGAVTVLDGTLQVQGGITAGGAITLNGSGVGDGGALRSLSGFNEIDGAITLGSATRINSDADRLFLDGGISGAFDLTFGGAGEVRVQSGITTGTGSVTKDGSGVLELRSTNTYTGTTTVNDGTLRVANGSALSDSAALIVNAGGTVEVRNSETVGNIQGAGNIILGGSALDVTLTFGNATPSSIFSGVISEGGGDRGSLIKQGSGSVTLSGNNTYTGTTTISEGTLQIGAGGTTGSLGTGAVINNGALVFDRGPNVPGFLATVSLGASISGTGTLTVTQGDNLILAGNNTYTGTTTINAGGRVTVGETGTTGTLGTGAVTNNGTLVFFRFDAITVASVISGAGDVTKFGDGTVTLSGASTYTGPTFVSFGVLDITGSIDSQSIEVSNFATLRVDGAAISNTATVLLNDSGNLTLTSNERIGALASSSATTTVTLGSHTLITGDAAGDTFAGVISGTGGLTIASAGGNGFTLTGANTYSGVTTINAGVNFSVGNGGTTGTLGTGAVVNKGVLEFSRSNDFTVANAISGTGVLSVFAGGTITLSGVSTTTGRLAVSGNGTLDVTGSIASQIVEVNSGSLRVDGWSLSNAATVTLRNSGNLTLTGNERIGALASSSATTTVTLGANTLTTGDTGNDTFAGVISGTGGLTKVGSGTFTLTGNNSYTGTTTINGGELRVTGSSAIADTGAVRVGNGGRFNVAAAEVIGTLASVDTNPLTSTASVVLGAALDVTGGGTTFAGNISGNGGNLNVNGPGTLTLTGTNTMTRGILAFGATAGVSITGTGTVAAADIGAIGGTITTDGGAFTAAPRVVVAGGTLTLSGSETIGGINGNGPGAFTGTVNVNGATTVLTLNGTTGTSGIGGTVAGTGTLNVTGGTTTVEAAGDVQVATTIGANGTVINNGTMAAVSNAGSFTNTLTAGALTNTGAGAGSNSGTLASLTHNSTGTFTNTNIITGNTTVSNGIVNLNAGSNLGDTRALQVTGGTVNVNATETIGTLAGGPGGTVNLNASTLTVGGNGNVSVESTTFSGAITGSGALTKSGIDTQVLSGTNTFTGATTINGGVLSVTGSLASQTVNVTSGSLRVDGAAVSDTATVTLSGTGNLALTGSERIGALAGSANTTVTLGGNTLALAAQTAALAGVTFQGSSGTDRLAITLGAAAGSFSLAGVTFANWTEGTDTVTVTGNALANLLTGNAGNNVLNGGLGNDTMVGGAGNDTYVVDAAGDQVFETTTTASLIDAGGIDTVQSAVTFNLDASAGVRFVERLTLTGAGNINGTGNALANLLTGNAGNNMLNGRLGNDTMVGGAGNDTYVVDAAGDQVFETTTTASLIDAGGIDTVQSAVTFNLDASAGVRFVERLTLTGAGNINGTGNALANLLTGNAGNNMLNGRLGNDTMVGGAGNDTYVVDAAGDRVFETTTTASLIDAGGIDTVQSAVTFNLDASAGVRFVERLTLTGAGNINGTGNALANLLTGNAGNNVLNGRLGNDTMIGGAGNDTFVFNTALGSGNVDRITDFSVNDDTIRLDDAIFAGLAKGNLTSSAFAANLTGEAADALDRIIYETDTGRLYFDADGSGSGVRVQFATLAANLALTNVDFVVF